MGFSKSDDFLSRKFFVFPLPFAQFSATTVSIYHESHQTHYYQQKKYPLVVFLTRMMHVFNPKDPFNVLFMTASPTCETLGRGHSPSCIFTWLFGTQTNADFSSV